MNLRSRPLAVTALAVLALLVAGCGAVAHISSGNFTTQNAGVGKTLFDGAGQCSSCHTLADASATGVVGPDLDDAFAAIKSPSFHTHSEALSTIADIVRGQIAYPDTNPGTGSPGMTPNLLHGQQARDVAVYVAMCAADPHCGIKAEPVGNTPG